MTGRIDHPENKHPEPYQHDLNPDANVGQNRAETPQEGKETLRTAFELKAAHNRLTGFTDDELRQIPVLPSGRRLEQGATYLDLQAREPREFTATADIVATEQNWYVPKSEMDYPLWNRLRGVTDPERIDTGGASRS